MLYSDWKTLTRTRTWSLLAIVLYGFFAAAVPILCYIAFNRGDYTYYEGSVYSRFLGEPCMDIGRRMT